MHDSRVVVVGDLMVDRFLWGSVSRISPEAPVPVVRLQSESASLGGAGNVARNLRSLGGRVDLIGVLGPDAAGAQFRDGLRREELSDKAIVDVPNRASTVKTRVIAHHQQVVRIDREATAAVPEEVEDRLTELVLNRLPDARALLISDYDKGAVTPRILGRILPAATGGGLVVAIDPKPANYEHYRPATVITPNAQEAGVMAALRDREDAGLEKAGEAIRRHLDCKAVLVTRGEAGMTLIQAGALPLRIPASAREVFDVTGAGDTVISALTLALVAGASLEEAAALANAAAGCAVGKLGTAVVQPEEILRAFQV
ncbi:MAG TPA: D-glycero-beta-D-manno-heptose-7-phosphate kinase [Candidatus Polarisedimenticolia bacterium]|nr:D-glycero-beta-D-manno-heptose-7-phosphate kinase [Candidatus Polarisedimenticolia bacterium]